MDERRLQIFRTVAELRNFSRAAEALHLSQPTVSQQIQALEEYFGVKLLDRSSKAVDLTPAGRELYARAGALREQFAETRRAVLQAAAAVSGPLTVGASLTIGEYVLPQVLAGFTRAYPQVELRLQIANTEQVCQLVLNGSIDVGLVEGEVVSPDLAQEPFLDDELLFVAPADHPWREMAALEPRDLLAERWIMREQGSGTRQVLAAHLQAVGIEWERLQVVSELASTEAIKGAVEAGMGVAALSAWTVRKELRLGSLLARPALRHPMRRAFQVVYPRRKTLIPAAAALLRLLPWAGRQ